MKRTEYLSFRTDEETKKALEELAAEKKWSLSFAIEEIIKDWLKDNKDKKDKI